MLGPYQSPLEKIKMEKDEATLTFWRMKLELCNRSHRTLQLYLIIHAAGSNSKILPLTVFSTQTQENDACDVTFQILNFLQI